MCDLAHGELGVDLIAILAIVGALLPGEPFAAGLSARHASSPELISRPWLRSAS